MYLRTFDAVTIYGRYAHRHPISTIKHQNESEGSLDAKH